MDVLVNPCRLNLDRENSSLKLEETRKPPEGRAEKNLVSGQIWSFFGVARQVYTCTVRRDIAQRRRLPGHARLLAINL